MILLIFWPFGKILVDFWLLAGFGCGFLLFGWMLSFWWGRISTKMVVRLKCGPGVVGSDSVHFLAFWGDSAYVLAFWLDFCGFGWILAFWWGRKSTKMFVRKKCGPGVVGSLTFGLFGWILFNFVFVAGFW